MSTGENKHLVRAYYEEVVGTGNTDRIDQFISPDYVEVYRGVSHPIGLEGAGQHVAGVRRAFPDLRVGVEHQIAEDDWVVSCVTVRGTHAGAWLGMRPSNAILEFTAVNIDRVADGRIVEHGGAANLLETLLECDCVRIVDPTGAEPSRDAEQ